MKSSNKYCFPTLHKSQNSILYLLSLNKLVCFYFPLTESYFHFGPLWLISLWNILFSMWYIWLNIQHCWDVSKLSLIANFMYIDTFSYSESVKLLFIIAWIHSTHLYIWDNEKQWKERHKNLRIFKDMEGGGYFPQEKIGSFGYIFPV